MSEAKPSCFGYPEFLKKEEEKVKEHVETAVLSTTTKVKRKAGKGGNADGRETPVPKE